MKKMLMRTQAFLAVGILMFGILFSPWQFNSSEVHAVSAPKACDQYRNQESCESGVAKDLCMWVVEDEQGAQTRPPSDTGYCTDIDECVLNTDGCVAGEICGNTAGSFTCTQCGAGTYQTGDSCVSCGTGYTSTTGSTSCTDIDECGLNTDTCTAGQSCTNTTGSYTCVDCTPGTYQSGDSCVSCAAGTVSSTGATTCTECAPGTYENNNSCDACASGYTSTTGSTSCTDIDECILNTDNCATTATCTNTTGSFTCACNAGYTGNGVTCSDVDECGLNTDTCTAGQSCTNTTGSYTCVDCTPGTYQSGDSCVSCGTGYTSTTGATSCTDIDECGIGDVCDEIVEEPYCGDGIVNGEEDCEPEREIQSRMSEDYINKTCSKHCTRVCTQIVETAPIISTELLDVLAHNTTSTSSLTVSVGDTLVITAEGLWRAGDSDDPYSREGTADGLYGYGEFNGFKYGALVGRIGVGSWFFVGTNFNQTVSESGVLELMYWDSIYEDNSGQVAVSVTVTTPGSYTEIDVVCPVDEEDDDDDEEEQDPTRPGGGQASSIGASSVSVLLETGPEPELTPATPESVILACEEDTYILDRFAKLSAQSMDIVKVIPAKYAKKLGGKAIRLSTQMSHMLRKTTDPEAKNNIIRAFVCKIEQLKEARGLRHAQIGAPSNGNEVDYLLQYLQDLAILEFTK